MAGMIVYATLRQQNRRPLPSMPTNETTAYAADTLVFETLSECSFGLQALIAYLVKLVLARFLVSQCLIVHLPLVLVQ